MGKLRIASWNVNFRGRAVAPSLGRLLREASADLVLLQEANPGSLDLLCEAAGLDWAVSAFDAGAPMFGGRPGRRRVSAIVGGGETPIQMGVLPALKLPERMIHASVPTPIGLMNVASYHAPPGVSWGITKVEHAHALLRWINATCDPVVVGADANTPLIDAPDPDQVRTHWHTGSKKLHGGLGDDITFGGRSQHRLQDAQRRWLEEHPDEFERIRRERPLGPLAVSHRTGRRKNSPGTPRRFDAVWVSPEFKLESVKYDYDGAIAAGSDHALVTVDLSTSG